MTTLNKVYVNVPNMYVWNMLVEMINLVVKKNKRMYSSVVSILNIEGWCHRNTNHTSSLAIKYLNNHFDWCNENFYKEHDYTKVTLDEFISLLQGLSHEPEQPKPIQIDIDARSYTIIPGVSIQSGCTTLDKYEVEKLIKAWKTKPKKKK